MNATYPMRSSLIHVAVPCMFAALNVGCYRSHTLDNRFDGGPDADLVDAQALDFSEDATQVDLGDGSTDMTVSECPRDLAGTWLVVFDHTADSCPGADGLIEFTNEGVQLVEVDICSQIGCSADNCRLTTPSYPDCTAGVWFATPCARLPRRVSVESSYHFLSATRFEGTMTWFTPEGTCVSHVSGTR
jgi:hypothetical protein